MIKTSKGYEISPEHLAEKLYKGSMKLTVVAGLTHIDEYVWGKCVWYGYIVTPEMTKLAMRIKALNRP